MVPESGKTVKGMDPLRHLGEGARDCQACDLSLTRTQVVWGQGPGNAAVMIVGEAPGKQEDLGGQPFSGAAGTVLDEFLDAAGLPREEVFITNVVKCRPPQNRNPHKSEIRACRPFLQQQLELIEPRLVISLGNYATRELMGLGDGISELQGQVMPLQVGGYRGSVLPLYHPAATLYDRSKRKPFLDAAMVLRLYLAGSDARASETRNDLE